MKTISKIEQEVNQIRHAIYEEMKDMTLAHGDCCNLGLRKSKLRLVERNRE